ncbi:MAG TPA: c-type cytochrome [Solirubrobacterales bacterium]|nr:c-type cytochrome [Solirubrobacterales bacterium]
MRGSGWKHLLTEFWAFIAVAVIAFVAGWLIGDLGSSTKTETVHIAASPSEGEEAGAEEAETTEPAEGGETEPQGAGSPGAQVFTGTGCGSCHTLSAAGSTGEVGPNLNEFLAPDDDTQGVEVMIVEPNSELAEGYPPNVMPQDYGQTLSGTEVHQLAEYLVESTPAKP